MMIYKVKQKSEIKNVAFGEKAEVIECLTISTLDQYV